MGTHEAPKRILGRAHDRLAAHIEAGVDYDRAAGLALERRNQRVVTRIGVLVHCLNARRVVNMRNGRKIGHNQYFLRARMNAHNSPSIDTVIS